MRWFDRIALCVLGGLIVWLCASLVLLGNKVSDVDERPVPVDIQHVPEPPTTAPRTCVADDADTNWAARFGVPDQPSCA